MKHKLIFLFVVALSLCTVTKVNAQFTRQQAIQKVLNEIVVADTGKINVYSVIPLKTNQDIIIVRDGDTLSCPYNYNWVFYVDDHPNSTWAHDCRYIFMDTITGNFQTTDKDFYPYDFNTADSVNFDLVKQIYRYPEANIPPNQNTQTRSVSVNEHLYAVIIVTEDAVLEPHQEYHNFFWDDASAMFCTLVNVYGYDKDHIYVHYYDGTSPKSGGDLDKDEPNHDYDIDYPASKSRILETFDNLAGTSNSDPNIPALTPSDQLFVFIDGHGINLNNHSTLGCAYPGPYYDYLYDNELAQHVENINCAQMLFLVQPCFSGDFATELTDFNSYNVSCKNRTVHTATSADLYSTTEFYMTNNRYTEYSFYWAAAARKGYPIFDQPWKTYDYEPGEFPFDQYYPFTDHPDDHDPDLNGDGFVQMEEAFAYADYMDAWSPTGYYHPDYQCWECYEEPQDKDKIGHDDDGVKYNNLITLYGLAGSVLDDDLLFSNRNYMAGDAITVVDNNVFTIEEYADFYMTGEDAKINVEDGGELSVEQYVNIYNNEINVNGAIDVDQNVVFNNMNLNLNNSNMTTTFDQTTFNNSILTNYGMTLNISNSNFNDCFIAYCFSGDVSVINTAFDRTWLYLDNQSGNHNYAANVENCTFSSENYHIAAIDVGHYDNFLIENNTMNGYCNGIQVWYSGEGAPGNQNINNNEIFNSMMSGIYLFNSTSSVSSNHLHNNKTGINIYDNCNIALYGNPDAQDYDEVNYITNNDSYEVYASTGSFPWYFRYNAIIDEDNLGNPDDPMVYYEPPSGGSQLIDVRYNCWTNNDNFDPDEDLYPSGYMVNPTWCPGGGGNKSSEVALQTFLDGEEHFKNEEYADAKTTFESVVELYPKTQYAGAAMKELFALEHFTDNDYSNLKQYYETNDSIQADTVLTKLADFLSNKCEIELENWQTAIDHFEDIIDNPESTEDSIFAIIDLGNTYLLMGDSTERGTARGRMLQYIPKSLEAFAARRNYLLSLLPAAKIRQKPGNLFETSKQEVLLQNAPNPFSNTTTVYYRLSEPCVVNFKVFDHVGREVKRINEQSQKAGLNKIELDMSDLPSGIYFYSIFVNGQLSDTKKMVLL